MKLEIDDTIYDVVKEVVDFVNKTYSRYCIDFKTDVKKFVENVCMDKVRMYHDIQEAHRGDEIARHEGNTILQ